MVRQGSPSSPQDLRKVGAGRAKSIIVLASGDGAAHDQDEPGQADMQAIKTLLALRRIPGALTKNHVVVELIDAHRAPVLTRLGGGGVEVIAMRETLARLMVQTARQSGSAHVYQDLMGYDGSEFYFKNFPELAGVTFGKLQPAMHNAIPVGIRRPAGGDRFETILNPADDLVIGPADELLVLAVLILIRLKLSMAHRCVFKPYSQYQARQRNASPKIFCCVATARTSPRS